MAAVREVHDDGWCVRLDLSNQVLLLDVPKAVTAGRRREMDAPLLPVPPAMNDGPVPASTLLFKAKQFDDGLVAAVELAAQVGAGTFTGKAGLLRSLAAAVTAQPANPATPLLLAACELGGIPFPTLPSLRPAVLALLQTFLADESRSKPLAFYTWSPSLAAVFRQDRLLQGTLDAGTAAALVQALDQTPGAWEAYDACLRLAARLTNPPAGLSLRASDGDRAFFPASRSHEQQLAERLYGGRPVPPGFDLMAELVRQVQAGEVGLEPGDSSGWYDYQTWSLEPLLAPGRTAEAPRLVLGRRYREHLEDLFRGGLALARETHVKQLRGALIGGAGGLPGPPPIWVRPALTVEPLPSLYIRRAACYAFVRSVLQDTFGAEALGGFRRLTPEGPVVPTLLDELGRMEQLFVGAAAAAWRDLGVEPPVDSTAASSGFHDWRGGVGRDPDVGRDARMMVPVYYDLERRKSKVWALLGWRAVPVEVSYRIEPRVLSVEPTGTPRANAEGGISRQKPHPVASPVCFGQAEYDLASPVMAEVYVKRVLDRDEFRRHCGRYKTKEAILANLR